MSSWKKKFIVDVAIDHETKLVGPGIEDFQISNEEIARAERYFFLKATAEVKHFMKKKDWTTNTIEKDGILHYSGRILEGQEVPSLEANMSDLQPLHFVRPVVERFSPVGYSIMLHSHEQLVKHRIPASTLRESRNIAFIYGGRDLANEIRDACVTCRRFKAKLIEVEMGKVHPNRLIIAPAFCFAQIDLFGPYTAICEHNHRSTVDIYGVVFKDPASAAINIHVMQKYDTPAFIQAFTRHGDRYGFPQKVYIDEGSQLVKACKRMEINLIDVTQALSTRYQCGVEYETAPVSAHNSTGCVERSIREVKKLLKLTYSGLRMDILSYETAFSVIANELNSLPICIGTRTDHLDNIDLITPSRLLLGRNNRRALAGIITLPEPTRLLGQLEEMTKSWWNVWKDERLIDYIPQPAKWQRNNETVKKGDIVMFVKTESEQVLGQPVWRIGRIAEVEISRDGLIRTAIISYKNASEKVFRTTRRSVRKIAVLHHEGELELVQQLNQAARQTDIHHMMHCMK